MEEGCTLDFWSGFTRTAAEIEHAGHRFRVELRLVSLGRNVTLYRDGEPVQSASTPARFAEGEGAVVEVDASQHGLNRAVLHHARGHDPRPPAAGRPEAARSRLGLAHHVLSP